VRDDIANAETARARRLSVAANKIAHVDFDPDFGVLSEWAAEDKGVRELFSEKEWTEGTGEVIEPTDAEAQIDRAAELQAIWKTETGQLWQLGKHRLLIGDCTVRENVERLMGGERAELLFTSPPYAEAREYGGNNLSIDTLSLMFSFFLTAIRTSPLNLFNQSCFFNFLPCFKVFFFDFFIYINFIDIWLLFQ
jgi:hypothetical protein